MDGLQPVSGTSSDRKADVVFVHGLGGDARTTWMHDSEVADSFWPAWLAEDFPSLGVWTLGYAADPSAWQRQSMPLADHGMSVLEQLVTAGLGERPLMFIAHSLGGILVKQMLRHAESQGVPRWKPIARATRGIAFIATPHSGANIASFAQFVSSVLRLNAPVDELTAHHSRLGELHGWFLNTFLQGQQVVCRTYCERRELRPDVWGFRLPKGIVVVDATSAEPNIPNERAIPLDEDHLSICKPSDRAQALYGSIRLFARDCLASPAQTSAPLAPVPESSGFHDLMSAKPSVVGFATNPSVLVLQAVAAADPGADRAHVVTFAALDPARLGLSLGWTGPAPAQLIKSSPPRPRLDEVFEVLSEVDEIRLALFRTERGRAWVPSDVEYVRERFGVPDTQLLLADALSDGGGRLLVTGRNGIGKTREVAELAADYAAREWVVLVARPEADARLGPVGAIPVGLHDARVLVVVDNVHARIAANDDGTIPWAERLTQCIDSLIRQPLDDVRVVAIVRDEPRFERSLGLTPDESRWREFTRVRLPDLTDEGLLSILSSLAARAEVAHDPPTLQALVANSDRTARTLVINVDVARRRGTPLDHDRWLPSEGETWRHKWRGVRSRHPVANDVHASIRLLAEMGLPARLEYVLSMGADTGRSARSSAVEALIDEGLVGRRKDRLALFAPELSDGEVTPARSEDARPEIVAAVMRPAVRPKDWLDDLTALALCLLRLDLPEESIAAATLAIDSGGNSAALYRTRAGGRFFTNARELALEDLNKAIARDPDDALSWFLRGLLHYWAGDSDGVLNDMTAAHRLGHEAAVLHAQCGLIYYKRQQWPEAAAALSRAITLDGAGADGMLFYLRGVVHQQLGRLPEAESDFVHGLASGSGYEHALTALPALDAGRWKEVGALLGQGRLGHGADALMRAALGQLRVQQGRFAEAIDELSDAIDRGFASTMAGISASLEASRLPVAAQARAAMEQGLQGLHGDAGLYLLRGIARRETGQWDLALDDFAKAMDGGVAQARIERAVLYLRTKRRDEALQDLDASTSDPETAPAAHFLRGLQHAAAGRSVDARADFDAAIRLGRDDAHVYTWLARMRAAQSDLPGAIAALDIAIARPNPPADAWLGRAGLRLDLGQASGAEQDAIEALQRGADAAAAHALLGAARLNMGRLAEADEALSRAIELGRDDRLVYLWRASARVQLGGPDAEVDCDAAIDRGDRDGAALYFRGCARLDAARPGPALKDFEAAAAAGFNDSALVGPRGIARLRLGLHAEAERDLDAAVAAGTVPALIWSSRAEAREALGNTVGAIADLERALNLQPHSWDLTKRLSSLLVTARRYADAGRVLDAAVKHDPDRLDVRLERALVSLLAGRFETSEADLNLLVERLPAEAAGPRTLRSTARYGRGDLQGAIADLDELIARGPQNADALESRAGAYALVGRLDLAERDLEVMSGCSPSPTQAAGLPAFLALTRGDTDQARRGLAEAAVADPSGPWGLRLGLAWLFAGRVEEAMAAIARTLETAHPGDARLVRTELDALLSRPAFAGAVGADVIREQLDVAWRAERDA